MEASAWLTAARTCEFSGTPGLSGLLSLGLRGLLSLGLRGLLSLGLRGLLSLGSEPGVAYQLE